MSFRNGFIAGLLLAIILGVWLSQLWQPARQVSLHTEHLLRDVAEKRWARIEKIVAADYQDDWGHDRASALARLRQVLSYTRNARIEPSIPIVRVGEGEGSWRARITFAADPNEVTDLIRSRVNALEEPFDLRWRRQSWKPWDWQLVRVSNPALELRGY